MADYEITIPGLSKIFKYKESNFSKLPEKTRERIIRMREKKSPIPQPLKWIPGLINIIDDAQDLLFTAAYMAKPLLRRVPKKYIPYVGWALTAMDIANMATFMLGFAMNPCLKKPDFINSTKHTARALKYPQTKFDMFVKKGGWRGRIAFALQAGQAMETVFGKGLQLGSIFGTLSDLFWLGDRALGGEKYGVKIKLPPKDDIIYKAAKLMAFGPITMYAQDILSDEDHMMLIAAMNIATGIL